MTPLLNCIRKNAKMQKLASDTLQRRHHGIETTSSPTKELSSLNSLDNNISLGNEKYSPRTVNYNHHALRRLVKRNYFLIFIILILIAWKFLLDESSSLLRPMTTDPSKTADAATSVMESNHGNNKKEYPLKLLNISSAEEAYQRGFWQRTKPYPLHSFGKDTTCNIPTDGSRIPDWQKRVPYVLMIGSQKGGTTAMAYYLYNHPSIPYLPSKELHFFDETMDQQLPSPTTKTDGDVIKMNGPDILKAYHNTIAKEVPLEKLQKESSKLHLLDATPNYLFVSDRSPTRIFCACSTSPKLLALLRNPIDRAWSQYHMQLNHDIAAVHADQKYNNESSSQQEGPAPMLSFEEYIDLDMKVLREVGVVLPNHHHDDTSFRKHSGSRQEFLAWKTYTKLGINSPIGRGLYSIQLRHWFQTMEEFNKPKTDFMIINTDDMLRNSSEVYTKVLEFLKLPYHGLKKYDLVHKTKYGSTGSLDLPPKMKAETRKRLEDFYRPYNTELKYLLGPEWENVW